MPRLPLLLVAFLFGSVSAWAQIDPALTNAPGVTDPEATVSSAARGADADLAWQWTNNPRWMRGRDFGGEAFFGSIARGRYFVNSTVGPSGDVPIEIVLSTGETTLAQVFRRDQGYEPVGVGTFPGAVYDVSDPDNPRRLNVALSEDANQGSPNMTWDPDSGSDGKREYLWVMDSDYDGTGTTYENINILNDTVDLLYVWEGRVEPGRSFFETDPATLALDLAFITDFEADPGNGDVALSWAYDASPEVDALVIYQGIDSPAAEAVAILDPAATSYLVEGLDPATRYYFRAEALDADGEVVDVSREVYVRAGISSNMSLIGSLDPASTYGDIWGYVDPATNREYALLCARDNGLYVIDVTEDTPVEVGFVSGFSDAKDVKTYGHYAYLVNEYAPLQIIDLSDPTAPAQVNTLSTGGSDGGSHNVLIEGDYLYVVGGRSPGGLRIFSLADPVNPELVGTFEPTYYHDVEVRNDTLYAAAIYDEGVDIIDVSDKSTPSLISTFIYGATYMGAHNVCSTDDGSYVFVGDEIGSGTWTRVFDVRDPHNVEQVAEIVVNEAAPVHNCYVKDDLLYIAHYTEGVQVFDVSDPTTPTPAAFYDTYPQPGAGFAGNWTTYPYLPSGKILASDMQRGLLVLQLDSAPVADEPSALPASGVTLEAAYPNPSTGTVTVPFLLDEAAHVRLTLIDVLGREVAVLADEFRSAGAHSATFDGSTFPAGAYFYRLETDGAASAPTRPLTILR